MNIFDQSAQAQQAAQTAATSPVTTVLAAYPGITASAQSGDVTLTGTVEDGATIATIIAAAQAVAGVTSVTSNIEAADLTDKAIKMKVDTANSNLNIRKEPSTDAEIVGKAAHEEVVTVVKKTNADWYLIKTDDGETGYSATQYLTAV
jgi:hypothetical protein